MAPRKQEINYALKKMHNYQNVKEKGTYGEQAVFSLVVDLKKQYGGIVYHSLVIPAVPRLVGNLKLVNKDPVKFKTNTMKFTEIDIVYVSNNAVYLIEVKSYKAKTIKVDDYRIMGVKSGDKNPVHQNEMHARHFWENCLKKVLQSPEQVVPIVCLVDESKVIDDRCKESKNIYIVSTLNNLYSTIEGIEEQFENSSFKSLNLKKVEDAVKTRTRGFEQKV